MHTMMRKSEGRDRGKIDALLLCDSLELDGFIGVLPATSGTATVKVLLNVMPAEAADLVKKSDTSFIKATRRFVPGNHRHMA